MVGGLRTSFSFAFVSKIFARRLSALRLASSATVSTPASSRRSEYSSPTPLILIRSARFTHSRISLIGLRREFLAGFRAAPNLVVFQLSLFRQLRVFLCRLPLCLQSLRCPSFFVTLSHCKVQIFNSLQVNFRKLLKRKTNPHRKSDAEQTLSSAGKNGG